MDEAKLLKLIESLEDMDVKLQRMQLMCQQIEKELKFRLNDKWEVINK